MNATICCWNILRNSNKLKLPRCQRTVAMQMKSKQKKTGVHNLDESTHTHTLTAAYRQSSTGRVLEWLAPEGCSSLCTTPQLINYLNRGTPSDHCTNAGATHSRHCIHVRLLCGSIEKEPIDSDSETSEWIRAAKTRCGNSQFLTCTWGSFAHACILRTAAHSCLTPSCKPSPLLAQAPCTSTSDPPCSSLRPRAFDSSGADMAPGKSCLFA